MTLMFIIGIVLVLMILTIIWTIWRLVKNEDERGRLIVQEAAAHSFGVVVFMLIIEIVVMAFQNLNTDTGYYFNPFTYLFVISLFFLITLKARERKYKG